MNLGRRSYVVVVGVSLVYLCVLGFIHQGHPGTFIMRGILVSSIIWCFSFSSRKPSLRSFKAHSVFT